MPRKAEITCDEVATAAQSIINAGDKPTQRNVYELLGRRGSMTTISSCLRKWREEMEELNNGGGHEPLPYSVLKPLIEEIRRREMESRADLENDLRELGIEMSLVLEESNRRGQEIEEREAVSSAMERERDTLSGRVAELEKTIVDLQQARDQETRRKEQATLALASADSRCEALGAQFAEAQHRVAEMRQRTKKKVWNMDTKKLRLSLVIAVFCIGASVPCTVCADDSAEKPYKVYWGDLHTHTNISLDARLLNAGDTEESILFALNESNLDFMAVTDHDIAGLTRRNWEEQQAVIESYNEKGIIVFPGFEFTDTNQGHLNVFFRNSEEAAMIRATLRRDPSDLWKWLNLRDADAITIPHHTALAEDVLPTYDWEEFTNGKYQRVVEIYSQHGSSESIDDGEIVDPFGEDGAVFTAYNLWLENGNPALKLGIVGSTDDNQTRPGGVWEDEANMDPFAPFKTAGGLAAVLAEPNASRDVLFDAIRKKRTYATTGVRIAMEFVAETPIQKAVMGETLLVGEGVGITFRAVAGGDTARINRIELIRDGNVIATSRATTTNKDELVVLEETVVMNQSTMSPRSWFMVKAYQEETEGFTNYDVDGKKHLMEERAWSSPIFVEVIE